MGERSSTDGCGPGRLAGHTHSACAVLSSDWLVNVNKWSYACRHPVVFRGTRFASPVSWRCRVADVGFDSDKHAQTNGDMGTGGGDHSMTRARLSDV